MFSHLCPFTLLCSSPPRSHTFFCSFYTLNLCNIFLLFSYCFHGVKAPGPKPYLVNYLLAYIKQTARRQIGKYSQNKYGQLCMFFLLIITYLKIWNWVNVTEIKVFRLRIILVNVQIYQIFTRLLLWNHSWQPPTPPSTPNTDMETLKSHIVHNVLGIWYKGTAKRQRRHAPTVDLYQ